MKNDLSSPALLRATRRQILRTVGLSGIGLGTGALAFRPLANAADIPKRLVVFYTIGGVDPAWDPVGTKDNWELSAHLEPLKPFKSKLNLISGLESRSFGLFGTTGEGGHETRSQHALAAWPPAPAAKPGGVSFDNFIGEKLRAIGRTAPIDHLYLQSGGAASAYHDRNLRPSVRSNGEIRNPVESPAQILNLYFPTDPKADPMAGRKSAYLNDFLKREFELYAKSGKMDVQSKRRFSDHLDRLRDLEALLPGGGKDPSSACARPMPPVGSNLAVRNRFFAETVATTLACDTSRVVLIDMAWAVNPALVGGVSEFNLAPGLETIHELGHQVHGGSLSNDAKAREKLLQSFRLQCIDPLAQMLAAMDAIEEPDGKTLLDHSVVLWCQQSSDGNHNMKGFRYLLAGSGGGYFKTNQYLQLPGRSITDVWVSVANAMGISDVNGIASPHAYDGPVDELR